MKKKIKLKKPARVILMSVGVVIGVILIVLIVFLYNRNKLMKLGYSQVASDRIIFSFKGDYVLTVGKNKMLNAAFESDKYLEKNLDNYRKIKYQPQKDVIDNINKLLKIGYSDYEISIILEHGNNKDVTEFTKKKKVRYVEEFLNYSYAKLKNYDRYLAYMENSKEDEETTVLHVNLDLDKNDYEDAVKHTKFNTTLFINKHNYVDAEFKPKNMVKVASGDTTSDEDVYLNKEAYQSFKKMKADANAAGLNIFINSGYRSYQSQGEVWNTYLKLYGENYVLKYVAKPGFSEHQTGLSIDLSAGSASIFSSSKEAKWCFDNSYKYGFIYRYPKGLEAITGYNHEAWHYRYVGKKIAKYIEEHNMTYDEYYIRFLDEK